jgi:DNA-binding response OmpR family regulator
MARILLVEDDPALARGVSAMLRSKNYAVDVVECGEEAFASAMDEPDLGLPDIDGIEVLRRLRKAGSKTPVLVLSARDAVADRITGLDHGADDYLMKPFDPDEMEARIRALLRRAAGEASPVIRIGALEIDPARATATLNGTGLALRRREWAVLERLAARRGKLVSKERLAAEIFGYDEPVAPNAVEVYIARLRRKLEPGGPEIRTMRGLGYLLDPA